MQSPRVVGAKMSESECYEEGKSNSPQPCPRLRLATRNDHIDLLRLARIDALFVVLLVLHKEMLCLVVLPTCLPQLASVELYLRTSYTLYYLRLSGRLNTHCKVKLPNFLYHGIESNL